MADGGGEAELREELARLIAGAVRVHLPYVDELTARAIADTALRARAAESTGQDQRRREGGPWWAMGGALMGGVLLAAAGGALAGLAALACVAG